MNQAFRTLGGKRLLLQDMALISKVWVSYKSTFLKIIAVKRVYDVECSLLFCSYKKKNISLIRL